MLPKGGLMYGSDLTIALASQLYTCTFNARARVSGKIHVLHHCYNVTDAGNLLA
jgi:hypothetical protein